MALIAGCSSSDGSTAAATGVVLLDGEPQSNVLVSFSPVGEGSSAFAATDSDGRFSVQTTQDVGGLAPGEYTVRVERTSPEDDPNVTVDEDSLPPIPERYLDDATSGLRVTVSATDENDFKIELSSADE
jgi:hypothetical protein